MGMQIALVKVDNWQGLYVNGRRVNEDHQITIAEVMNYVLYNHVDPVSYTHLTLPTNREV